MSWLAAFIGAFGGAYSHVLLDSVMHWDMYPSAPISQDNVLLHLMSSEQLHILCLSLGVAGGMLLSLSRRERRT